MPTFGNVVLIVTVQVAHSSSSKQSKNV